eukprot:jgi/Mesen1/2599/ME000166S01723
MAMSLLRTSVKHHRHVVARILPCASFSTQQVPPTILVQEVPVGTTPSAPKPSGGGAGTLLVGAGLIAALGGGYYYYVTQVEPASHPPVPQSPPVVTPLPSPVPADMLEKVIVETPATSAVSPRDELLARQSYLKTDLEELRKQKRDQVIDMKKKAIKDDLKEIEKRLKEKSKL